MSPRSYGAIADTGDGTSTPPTPSRPAHTSYPSSPLSKRVTSGNTHHNNSGAGTPGGTRPVSRCPSSTTITTITDANDPALDAHTITLFGDIESGPLSPLLGKHHHPWRAWRVWLDDELGPPDALYSHLVITVSTSMLDAVMFRLFGTFATNQTGNTVFLTLAALHRGSRKLVLAATSLGGFFGAGLVFGQLGAIFGHRRRGWVLTTMSIQCVVMALFVWLVSPLAPTTFDVGGEYQWVPMLLSAVQGGPQVVMATNLGIPEMPTAMVTSAYAALISDPHLFKPHPSRGRDRRIVYLSIFWFGSFLGLGVEQAMSAWFAAFIAAVLKIVALIMIARASPSLPGA